MVLATWWGWGDAASIALAVALRVLLRLPAEHDPAAARAGMVLGAALGIALVADTLSIATMESSTTPSSSSGRERWTPASATSCSGPRSRSRSRSREGRRSSVSKALIKRGKGHALAHAHHQAH